MKFRVLTFASLLTFLPGLPLLAAPLTTVLELRGRLSMEELSDSVLDPASPRFRKFYSPEEIRQIAGPSDEAYQGLLENLRDAGFAIKRESPTHLWLSVEAEEQVYATLFNAHTRRRDDGTWQVLSRPFIPPQFAAIQNISGLDTTRKLRPKHRRNPRANSGSGTTPNDIRRAYGLNAIYAAGINGVGQHIAIATYDDFYRPNILHYFDRLRVRPRPTVDRVRFNGKPVWLEDSASETELDAEFAGMIAPGAAIHVFTSALNDDPNELLLFTAILDDGRAKIVNYSWGSCESEAGPDHKAAMAAVFQRAIAQGVNIFVATGDEGSDACGSGKATADWPSGAPYVVAVGGTTMHHRHGKLNERAWPGSGGGVSEMWDRPEWQGSFASPFLKRSYPDVAFNADPDTGQACYTGRKGHQTWDVVGGTSIAAPQWAGYMALVENARQRKGKGGLGFLNPVIYGLDAPQRAQVFHDILSGDNGHYRAGPGWDAVTGFGSMQAGPMLNLLVNL